VNAPCKLPQLARSKIIYATFLELRETRERFSVDLIRAWGSFTSGNNVLRSFERHGAQKKGREMNDSVYITQTKRVLCVRTYGTRRIAGIEAESWGGAINKSVRGNPGTKGRMLARGRFPRVDTVDRSKGAFRDTRNNGTTAKGEFESHNLCRVPAENFCVPHSEHSSVLIKKRTYKLIKGLWLLVIRSKQNQINLLSLFTSKNAW